MRSSSLGWEKGGVSISPGRTRLPWVALASSGTLRRPWCPLRLAGQFASTTRFCTGIFGGTAKIDRVKPACGGSASWTSATRT